MSGVFSRQVLLLELHSHESASGPFAVAVVKLDVNKGQLIFSKSRWRRTAKNSSARVGNGYGVKWDAKMAPSDGSQ
jgi:hypothetical protein